MNNKPKLVYGIKGKLISAACMLLVAVIMVVSSTYAWFTLSTAPEVSGISTAVGANGSLEMALLPKSGSVEEIFNYNGEGSGNDKNNSWGNLVDLKDAQYGLGAIVLNPALLNENGGKINVGSPLTRPTYGADGRVDLTNGQTAVGGEYTGTSFTVNDSFGVRAVGVASGMTARQQLYRTARNTANDYMAKAKAVASQSLSKNGGTLANIALKHAMDANATFTGTDIAPLKTIVTDLVGNGTDKGALDYIELAYKYYLLALAASATGEANGVSDETVATLAQNIETTELATLVATYGDAEGTIAAAVEKYTATLTAVTTANDELTPLSGDAITWDQLSTPLNRLAKIDALTVNGVKASEAKDKLSEIVSGLATYGGIQVTMASGGGVYVDIADHCGDYTATVNIDRLAYEGIVLENAEARMSTKTGVSTVYLTEASNLASNAGAPASADGTDSPMTEYYGYIIDLAFRTNAADSSLLLQTTPVDRISTDNSTAATMGHGSTMSFTKGADEGYTVIQMQELMKALRIVFFDSEGTILAKAQLDMEHVVVENDSKVTANLYLVDAEGKLITDEKAAAITELTRNQAQRVSVLVYLDGEKVGNDDVAATVATSMTGSLNLQFASSATLVPMDYTFSEDEQGNTPAQPQIPTINLAVDGTQKLDAVDGATFYVSSSATEIVATDVIEVAADGTVTAKKTGTAYVLAVDGENKPVKAWIVTVQ